MSYRFRFKSERSDRIVLGKRLRTKPDSTSPMPRAYYGIILKIELPKNSNHDEYKSILSVS